jgi:hypothetical protein
MMVLMVFFGCCCCCWMYICVDRCTLWIWYTCNVSESIAHVLSQTGRVFSMFCVSVSRFFTNR